MTERTIGAGTVRAQLTVAYPALRASALPFLVSRAIVLLALAIARFVADNLRVGSVAARSAAHAGLLGWDASWYSRIAFDGYAGLGRGALRFFPLLPVLARVLRAVPGVSAGTAVLVVSNVACLAALAVLYRLVVFELGDEACARRAVWILALAPPAFVLVMGYAESLLLLTSLVAFLGFRQRRYGLAIIGAFLAGLARPPGILLAIPAAIEVVANWRAVPRRERVLGVGTVLAAPAGTAAYLGWVQVTAGNFDLPLSEQLSHPHRGRIADPFVTVWRDSSDLFRGAHLGSAQHAPWAVLLVALAAYLVWKLPPAYGWYAVASLAVALSSANLDSLERYALGCFPFAIAAAMLTRTRSIFWTVVSLSGALLLAYALLAFLGAYVP